MSSKLRTFLYLALLFFGEFQRGPEWKSSRKISPEATVLFRNKDRETFLLIFEIWKQYQSAHLLDIFV